MSIFSLSNGVCHKVTNEVRDTLSTSLELQKVWNSLTPLARNEWLCWVTSAKKVETKARRMKIMSENLKAGKRRPCCWAGCMHR